MGRKTQIQLTIVYDNNTYQRSLRADWGFSCLIRGFEKTILFDTGTNGRILANNMEKLGIRPDLIDCVLLSHFHRDHTGGLNTLLESNPGIEVWLPEFFPKEFKKQILTAGASVVQVSSHRKICEGAFTTGIINGWIKEQSLVLHTTGGLVVVTGCAHPRLTKILFEVKTLFDNKIYMALGGFHLTGFEKNELEDIIKKLAMLGVQKIGPCHCTGETARQMFSDAYKENYVELGVGKGVVLK